MSKFTKEKQISSNPDGVALYGDDFGPREISKWFYEEAEAYANLGAVDRNNYVYAYHALNRKLGFEKIKGLVFDSALGVGSAYGDEFIPIVDQIRAITILDPGGCFRVSEVAGRPISYFAPNPSGELNFQDENFDLVLCFGVLHHVPNVSFVIRELGRCLKKSGYILIREPTVSMGDWTKPRPGLTKNERGIPVQYMNDILRSANLDVVSFAHLGFGPFTYAWGKLTGSAPYNSPYAVLADFGLSYLTKWNYNYSRGSFLKRLAPTMGYWVARKL